MKLILRCAKGCGGTIEVGDEQIEEAKKHGTALVAAHEVCPRDKLVGSIYRVVIEVWRKRPGAEDDELLTKVGGTTESADFKTAIPSLGQQMGEQWSKVVGMADIIDMDEEVIEQMQGAAEEEAANYEAEWQAKHPKEVGKPGVGPGPALLGEAKMAGKAYSPCGQLWDSVKDAADHAMHCDQCDGAIEKFSNQ